MEFELHAFLRSDDVENIRKIEKKLCDLMSKGWKKNVILMKRRLKGIILLSVG